MRLPANRHDDGKKRRSSWKRDVSGEKVLITNNEGEREESGRDSRLPSRRIRAKSVHACSREFYSFPSFLSFFFIFSNFQFLFSLVCTCVCVVCVFFPSFHAFSPLSFFFLFPFNRQKKEESLETKLLIALRVRSGCVVLSTSYTTYRTDLFCFVFFFLFLSYLSALYRVCTRVYVRRVCVSAGHLERRRLRSKNLK